MYHLATNVTSRKRRIEQKKKLQKLIKLKKKLQKVYLTYYNLLIVQNLWQARNQILLMYLIKADVFENFRNICLEVYRLDHAKFLSGPALVWQAVLKKTKVKLNLLTNIDMLLMVEKGIRGGICHSIYQYVKANNKYMKDFDNNKELAYLHY